MAVTPYLHFEGTCEEAITHYARALGAKAEIFMRHGDAPPEMNAGPEYAQQVLHAAVIGDEGPLLMASDSAHGKVPAAGSVSLSIGYPDVEKAKAVFTALGEGGEITMPMQPVFWGGEFGSLTDRFGMHWNVSAGYQN